jgi:hypothetical protein
MKKFVFTALTLCLAVGGAQASNVGWNINVNVGGGHTAPAPVMVPIMVEAPPLFLLPATLGFHVAVGIPYDMFRINNRFYVFHGQGWYMGSHYNGPWTAVSYDHLPRGLRKHTHTTMISYRDAEYRHYEKNRKNYRGKSYRPQENKRHDSKGKKDKGRDDERGQGRRGH